MFSALRKLVATETVQDGTKGDVPDGMRTMGQSLQRKFAKGVQYNMKVIIKGDRNTGKTTLFRRLQGEKFKEEYIPTPEIQVESIQWGYKATDDVVKVEVWDVVDKGKTRKHPESLKLENEAEDDDTPCLDASFLDVYKGTHGVVMMLDITKQWTWQYVERELPKVPHHIPVLVLGNLRDMGPHRTVDEEDTRFYIEHFQRPEDSAPIMYAESSMRNGFGLRYLHTFFNIPYLQLQRETLLIQLETNKLELNATEEELLLRKESEDQSYELYLQGLETKRHQKRKKGSPSSPQTLPVPNGQTQQAVASSSSSSTPARLSPAVTPPPAKREVPLAQSAESSPQELPPGSEATPPSLSQKFSRWFSSSEAKVEQGKKEDGREATIEPPAQILNNGNTTITSVEDFVPDEGIDRSFFEEEPPLKNKKKGRKEKKSPVVQTPPEPEGSSDSEVGENPMVAGFQEELDSEDEGPSVEGSTGITELAQAATKKKVSSREIELSSDSEPETPVIKADEDIDSSDDERSESTPEVYDADKSETSHTELNEQSLVSGKEKPKKAARLKLSMDTTDIAITKGEEKSSSSEPESVKTPSSAGIQLQLEDLNFLESVTSKSSKTSSSKKPSSHQPQPNYEFDTLVNVNEEEPSDTETSTTTTSTTSSAKKKKHRTKEKKDEEKSHRKHKHKKHREKDSKEEDSKKEEKTDKKKKRKSKKKEEPDDTQREMDDLEMFLEGGDPVGYEAI